MVDEVVPPLLRSIQMRIGILPQAVGVPDFETRDGETIVIVSIGVGETQVSVVSDEARRRSQWTAVYGWSSLCGLPFNADGDRADLTEVPRALRGDLRRYGRPVSTEGFLFLAQEHLRNAIGHILDRTIGDGAGYDRIVLAAPVWLHEAVSGCLDLRPHIWNEIQDT